MNSDPNTNLIWMDLEMTGVDPEVHRIMQVATLITNQELEVLYDGTEIIIHQPEEALSAANGFVKENLREILEKSRKSTIAESEAEEQLLQIVEKFTTKKKSPLCGNSIWVDRRFVFKYMPRLETHLLYRNIDVSSIKELYKRWRPDLNEFKKKKAHTALEDIKESIAELKYYRKIGFIG